MLQGSSYFSGQEQINIRANKDIENYESESDVETILSVESFNDENSQQDDLEAKLDINCQYLDGQVHEWEFMSPSSIIQDTVRVMKKPTASQLQHLVLNPYLYRGLQQITSLNHLAEIVGAPSTWLDTYTKNVMNNALLRRILRNFVDLEDNSPEIVVQSAFDDVVTYIGFPLGLYVTRANFSPFVVGALFAHPTYDVRAQSDTIFKGLSGNPLLATEAQRATAFPVSKLWHHGSRGIQTLCTLYRTGCPTILYSQKCFKVFVENDSRDTVFTWPFDSGNSNQNKEPYSRERVARSYTLQVMTSVIMQVITICLLACGEDDLISYLNPVAVEATPLKSIQASSSDAFTCEKEQGRKRKREEVSSKKQARSGSLRNRISQYISGYIDGQPIYTKVRVMEELTVAVIVLTQKSSNFLLLLNELNLAETEMADAIASVQAAPTRQPVVAPTPGVAEAVKQGGIARPSEKSIEARNRVFKLLKHLYDCDAKALGIVRNSVRYKAVEFEEKHHGRVTVLEYFYGSDEVTRSEVPLLQLLQ
ncbi:hypothetical protein MIR68_002096 [Amoeboaphelidium protococcarum]|nr:hypothetical protein MIR68_002096 [Amoeboaphelidium protococcarum]